MKRLPEPARGPACFFRNAAPAGMRRTVEVIGHTEGRIDDAFAMMGLPPYWPFESEAEAAAAYRALKA